MSVSLPGSLAEIRDGVAPDGLAVARFSGSAFGGGQLEGRPHSPPDRLRRFTVVQCLGGRTATELAQHLVVRPGPGVHLTEVALHPLPELAVPHGLSMRAKSNGQLPASPGYFRPGYFRPGYFSNSRPRRRDAISKPTRPITSR